MGPRRKPAPVWAACALACLLAACGAAEKNAPPPERVVPRGVFDPSKLDLDRPCTLVTADDAAAVAGQPFYRTVAADVVDGDEVRCSQGVGAYGLHGMVEADVLYPEAGTSAATAFDRRCRAPGQTVEAPPAVDPAAPPTPAPAPIQGRNCPLASGGHALLLTDRLVIVRVRLGAGEIDAAASQRLAVLVSSRLPRN